MNDTQPGVPTLPPPFVNALRIFEAARLRLSVSASTMIAVNEALTNDGITFASAEVTMIPQTYVELTSEDDLKKMRRILALLDEEDDVQNVYHNWDEPDSEEE